MNNPSKPGNPIEEPAVIHDLIQQINEMSTRLSELGSLVNEQANKESLTNASNEKSEEMYMQSQQQFNNAKIMIIIAALLNVIHMLSFVLKKYLPNMPGKTKTEESSSSQSDTMDRQSSEHMQQKNLNKTAEEQASEKESSDSTNQEPSTQTDKTKRVEENKVEDSKLEERNSEEGNEEDSKTKEGNTDDKQGNEADNERADFQPVVGEQVGMLEIPILGLQASVYEGASLLTLQKGVAHYCFSAWPSDGEQIIFFGKYEGIGYHIKQCKLGDLFVVRLAYGTFHYQITKIERVQAEQLKVEREVGSEQLIISMTDMERTNDRFVLYAARYEQGTE